MVKQLSVFVENEVGSLAKVTRVLRENNISIRAIASFDSPEFGILRLMVDKTGEAKRVLTENGFIVKLTDVVAIELVDKPGELDRVMWILADARLEINYIYSFVLRGQSEPLMLMNLDRMEEAEKVLMENGVMVTEKLTQE